MPGGSFGTIKGQLVLDAKQAIAEYAAVRAANVATVTALNRGGAVMTRAGAVMFGAGAVIAGGFALAASKAADFEKQMDFLGAVSNTSAAMMEKVSTKALQLGQDTRYSAMDIADSFIELGKAGVTAEQIIGGVGEAVASLGAAADIPLVEASNIIVSAVQTFGMAAGDAVGVADKLAGAANASMVEVQDLGVSLKYAGGVAASIGVPFDDLNTSFALLGKYGIKGATAGTSMRQMLIGLVGNSNKAVKVMKELGIITADGGNKFFDATGKLKPLPEVMDILNQSVEGLTQAEKIEKLKNMFNVRALPTVLNLMKEGSAGFREMGAAIEETKAADVAAKRMDNLAGDIEILKGNLETFLIQAGTPMQSVLRQMVQGLTGLVQWFGSLSPSTQAFIIKALALTAALLIVMGTITMILGIGFRFASMMIDLVSAFRLVGTALKIAGGAMKAFSLSLMTNPVFLIIAAIVLLVVGIVLLWQKCEAFRNFMKAVGAAIVTAWNAVVEFFKGLPAWFSGLWESIKSTTLSVWNAIGTFFTTTIPTWFMNTWNSIVNGVSNFINSIVTWFQQLPGKISTIVSNLVSNVITFFSELPYRVGYFIGFMIGNTTRLMLELHTKIVEIVTNVVNAVIDWFQKLPGRVATFFTELHNKAVEIITRLKEAVISKATEIHNGIVDWVQKLPGRVATFFTDLHNRVVSTVTQLKDAAVNKVIELHNAIVDWVSKLPGRVSQFFTDLKNKAVFELTNLAIEAANAGLEIYNGIVSKVKEIPGAVSGAINNAIQAFKNMVSNAFNAAKSFANGLWEGFKSGLGINSPSFIEKQMVQITRVVDEETRNLRGQVKVVQGLGNRLTKISTMEAATFDVASTSALRALQADYDRLLAMQNDYSSMMGNSTPMINQRIEGTASMTSQINPLMNALTVRLPDDQLEELGKRSINVDMVNNNPIGEPTEVTINRQMQRLSALGVF